MKHRFIRTAATAATTLGLAAGVTFVAAGSAQAVASNWLCNTLSPASGGVVYGTGCVGAGVNGTGVGWFEIYVGGGAYQIVYRCNSFSFTPQNQTAYYVTGTGCTLVGTPPTPPTTPPDEGPAR
jgi:hypothetical protein